MAKMNIPEKLRKYNLKEIDLNCILLFIATGNKTYAWAQTIGIQSKSPNKNIMAGQWFKNQNIQMFLYDYDKENDNNKVVKFDVSEQGDSNTNIKKSNTNPYDTDDDDTSINAENIKELLETEFNKTKDPEKRTTLLIKIADFLSLNKTNDEDFQTPTIYLPARCKTCPIKP